MAGEALGSYELGIRGISEVATPERQQNVSLAVRFHFVHKSMPRLTCTRQDACASVHQCMYQFQKKIVSFSKHSFWCFVMLDC